MITDLIRFKVKQESIDEALAHMKEQIINTRNDEGCVMANVFQLKNDPTVLYLLLKWEDEESLKKHMEQPYDLEFRTKMDTTLAGPVEPVDWQQVI